MALYKAMPTLTLSNADNTVLRAWTQAVNAALLAGGWTLTADTGQVDLATINFTATHTPQQTYGYKVYKSPAEAGLSDIYMRIDFRNALGSAVPDMLHTIGWATDGAGNLVNQLSAPYDNRLVQQVRTNSVQTSASHAMRAGDGSFAYWFTNAGNPAMALSLERVLDETYTPIDRIFLYGSNNGSMFHQVLDKTQGLGPAMTSTALTQSFIVPTSQANAMGRENVAPGFVFPLFNGKWQNPSRQMLGSWGTSFGANFNVVPVEVYGVERSYLVLPYGATANFGGTNYQPLMLWD